MDWQTVKKELLENPDLRIAYDELEPEYAIIAQLIQARLDLGLTQAQLAGKIGTRQSNISRLEHGEYNPTISFLRKVASGLGKTIEIRLV